MPKGSSLAFWLLDSRTFKALCFAGCGISALQAAPVVYDLSYQATDLGMWGAGGANNISYDSFIGGSWNASSEVGGIESTFLGDFGTRAYASTSGNVGLNVNFQSTQGGIDVQAPYRVTLNALTNLSSAGNHQISIGSILNLTAGQSVVTTRFSSAEFSVDGIVQAKATIGGEVAVFDSVSGEVSPINIDARFPIFRYNQGNNNQISLFGLQKSIGTGLTLPLTSRESIHKVDNPFAIRVGTVTIAPPSLNATSGASFATNRKQDQVVNLSADIIGAYLAALKTGINPFDLRLDVGPLNWRGSLIAAQAGLTAGLQQAVTFTPQLHMVLRSSESLTYNTPNGPVTTNAFDTTDLNSTLTFSKASNNVIQLIPEFYISPTLNNKVDLLLSRSFSAEAMKMQIGKYGVNLFSMGPLYTQSLSVPATAVGLFNQNLDLSGAAGLQARVFGQGLTSAVPTIGNVASNEIFQAPAVTGDFATSNIDGTLILSNNSLYRDTVGVTISGQLHLKGSPNTFIGTELATAGSGSVKIDAGSTVQLNGGWLDLSDDQLFQGSYEVAGKFSYNGPDVTNNGARLILRTANAFENRSGGAHNGLRALSNNYNSITIASGASVAVTGSMSSSGLFRLTESGQFASNGFNNAEGTLVVESGSSLNTNASGTGTNTLQSLSGGVLQNGKYTLTGPVRYSGVPITTNNADITLLNSGATAVFLRNGSFNGLASLAQNNNLLTLTSAQLSIGNALLNSPGATLALTGGSSVLNVTGNFTNNGALSISQGTVNVIESGVAFNFTNNGSFELKNGGRLNVAGGFGNLVPDGSGTGTFSGGTWLINGTIFYGTGSTSQAVSIRRISAGADITIVGGGFFNQTLNRSGLDQLALNFGRLVLDGAQANTNQLQNSGSVTVLANSGVLQQGGLLTNSGSIMIGPGATFTTYPANVTDPLPWENVSAGGRITGLGDFTLAGKMKYVGPEITSIGTGVNLTLQGTAEIVRRVDTGAEDSALAHLGEIIGQFHLTNSANYRVGNLAPLTVRGVARLGTDASSNLTLRDGADLVLESGASVLNAGTIDLDSSFPGQPKLTLANGSVTLGGGGFVTLGNNAGVTVRGTNGGQLINQDNLIGGAGTFTVPLVNRGQIQSLTSAGLTFAPTTGALTNSGTIRASGSVVLNSADLNTRVFVPGPMFINNTVVTNFEGATPGRIESETVLTLRNTDINGGIMQVNGGGVVNLDNARILGGTLNILTNGNLYVTNTTGAANQIGGAATNQLGGLIETRTGRLQLLSTLANAGTLRLAAGSTVELGTVNNTGLIEMAAPGTALFSSALSNADVGSVEVDRAGIFSWGGGTINNSGIISLGKGGTSNGTLAIRGNTTLAGGGRVQLGGIVNGPPKVWQPTGIVQGSSAFTLTNADNTIFGAGDLGAGSIGILNSAAGLIEAKPSGATLTIRPGTSGFSNLGTVLAHAGATVKIQGLFSNYVGNTLSGGAYTVLGTLIFDNADIVTNAANIELIGAAPVIQDVAGNSALRDFRNNAAAGRVRVAGNHSLTLPGPFTNMGQLSVDAGSTIRVQNSLTNFSANRLTSGLFYLGGTFIFPGADIVNNSAHIVLNGPTAAIRNETSQDGLRNFANNSATGRLTVMGGGTLIAPGVFTNDGELTVAALSTVRAQGALANQVGTTLTNGRYVLTGRLIYNGANIVTNAGDLTLNGPAAGIRDESDLNGLRNFAANTAGAKLTINAGASIVVTSPFAADGLITLGSSGTDAGGSLTAPSINGAATFSLLDASTRLTIAGGAGDSTLTGLISGPGGIIKAGDGVLRLTAANTYTGPTSITGGVLQIENSAPYTGAGPITVGSGGSLLITHNDTFGNAASTPTTGVTIEAGGLVSNTGPWYTTFNNLTLNGGELRTNGGANSQYQAYQLKGNVTAGGTGHSQITLGTSLFNVFTSIQLGNNTPGGNTTFVVPSASAALSIAPILADGVLPNGSGTATTGLIKTGVGGLNLTAAASSYTGSTVINSGTLSVSSLANGGVPSSIGASSNSATNLVLNSGVIRYVGSGANTDRQLTLGTAATLDASGTGALNLTNPAAVTLTGSNTSRTLNFTGTGAGSFAALVTNNGTGATLITKSGAGTWMFGGVNTYTGSTTITGGVMSVATLANGGIASGIGASPIAAANLVLNGGGLRYTGAAATTNRQFTVGTAGGTLDASGTGLMTFSSTAIALSGTNTPRTLTLRGTASGSLAAVLNNNGTGLTSLTKAGTGTWTLAAASSFTGATTVSEGTLLVTGSTTGSTTSVKAGATIGGTGSLGLLIVEAGGSVSPGLSPGTLSTRDFSLLGGGSLKLELGGTAPGQSDLLAVTGSVTLFGDASLSYSGGFFPSVGNRFFVVNNDSTDPVTGAFSNADGLGRIALGGAVFQIKYNDDFGGAALGNDVSLTVIAVPEPSALLMLVPLAALALGKRRRRRSNQASELDPKPSRTRQ